MTSFKVATFTFFVIFMCVMMTNGSSVNTCGNIGSASPQLAEECTGVTYKNGTCCYVKNSVNNVSYCVLLLGTPRTEAINNFESKINITGISVDCHSEFLTLSVFLIIGFFL